MPFDERDNNHGGGGGHRHDPHRMIEIAEGAVRGMALVADLSDLCETCLLRTLSAVSLIQSFGDWYANSPERVTKEAAHKQFLEYLNDAFVPALKQSLEGALDMAEEVKQERLKNARRNTGTH